MSDHEIIEAGEPVRSDLAVQQPVDGPLAMAMQAMKAGMTIADVREMMVLQREWKADQAREAYNAAMSEFKAEAVEIIKRTQVDFRTAKGRTQYKHAELSDVVEAVGPALAKHGFSWSWTPRQDKGWVEITCTLKHRLGHSESVTLGAPPDDSGGKNTIQSIISTKTYLERHTLKAICGVAEKGEDDDGAGGGETDQTEGIPKELLRAAREAALGGWKSLAAFIKDKTEEERLALEPVSVSLKEAAMAADKAPK